MSSERDIDISIIVNAHNEGVLLFRTLKSVALSKKYAESKGLVVETILILDAPNVQMKNLVNQYFNLPFLDVQRLIEVQVQSPGLSRNAGVLEARGKYIAFMDGDDLCSENWICDSFNICETNQSYIAHPEICVFFDNENHWWRHFDQREESFDKRLLLNHNFWLALSFAKKSIYESVTYHGFTPKTGFSFEDWHWNCETIANGFIHVVVPRTTHFIRKKRGNLSLNILAAASNCLIPASKLLIDKSIWSHNTVLPEVSNFEFGQKLKKLLNDLLPPLFIKFFKYVSFNFLQRSKLTLPDWVVSECRNISGIEPLLNPSSEFLFETKHFNYVPWRFNEVISFQKNFYEFLDKKFDHVFIFGASDSNSESNRMLIESLEKKGLSLIVILTDGATPWRDNDLSYEGGVENLARFLTQKCPRFIHVFNSLVGWEMMRDFGNPIALNSKVSGFLGLNNADSKIEGCFIESIAYVSAFFSSGSDHMDFIEKGYGLTRDIFGLRLFGIYDYEELLLNWDKKNE